jgi:hypothetical protein
MDNDEFVENVTSAHAQSVLKELSHCWKNKWTYPLDSYPRVDTATRQRLIEHFESTFLTKKLTCQYEIF